jgi:hypothetical protein
MSITITVTDRSAEMKARYSHGAKGGMNAVGKFLVAETYKAFESARYYKGGAFRSTLLVKQSIRYEVWPDLDGWFARVGTNKEPALSWELGHQNHFTGKYERVPIWVPTALANVENMRKEFAKIVARVMGAT